MYSLRAFRRARDGAAQGRCSWGRSRWPDATIEGTGAKCDLRNEQQREKREESREKREARREKREERSEKRETITIKKRGWKDAKVRSQKGGMVPKRVGPWEGRGKRAEKREKREERRDQKKAARDPQID